MNPGGVTRREFHLRWVSKNSAGEMMLKRLANWGYSPEHTMLIGLLETTGGLLVLAPATADFGALIIGIMMIGAIWTHLSTGIGSPLFAAIYIAMAAALGVLRFPDAEWLLRVLERKS
jgi:uncharacterized membrane protein YphA (DoxX/SURF4 family)